MNVLRLIPEGGGNTIVIDQDRVLVGRDPASDVHLRDASVSRLHAEIRKDGDAWTIIDRGSGNGVLIEGVRKEQGVLLPGQTVQLGILRFRVEIDRGDDGATVILRRSPLADSDATLIAAPPRADSVEYEATPTPEQESDPEPAAASAPNILTMVVGGFVLACLGLLALFLLSNRSQTAPDPGLREGPIATPTAARMPTLLPATPTPTPAAAPVVVPRPRGSLLISTDTSADVFVDGTRHGLLRAGGMQRVQVSPGEHIVSFHIGEARYDRLVRVREGEQAVVPFTQEVAPEVAPEPPVLPASPLPSVSSTPPSSASPAVRPALLFSTPAETPSPTPIPGDRQPG